MNNDIEELYAAMCDVVNRLSEKDATFIRRIWNLEEKARIASRSLPARVNRRRFQREFKRECQSWLRDYENFLRYIDEGFPAYSYFSSAPITCGDYYL